MPFIPDRIGSEDLVAANAVATHAVNICSDLRGMSQVILAKRVLSDEFGNPLTPGIVLATSRYNFSLVVSTLNFYWMPLLFGAGSAHHVCSEHIFNLHRILHNIESGFPERDTWPSLHAFCKRLPKKKIDDLPSNHKLKTHLVSEVKRIRWDEQLALPLAKAVSKHEWGDLFNNLFGLKRELSVAVLISPKNAPQKTKKAPYTLSDLSADLSDFERRKTIPFVAKYLDSHLPSVFRTPIFHCHPLYRHLEGFVNDRYGAMSPENVLRLRGAVCRANHCDTATADKMTLSEIAKVLRLTEHKSGPGRPSKIDPQEDKELLGHWKAAKNAGSTRAEFERGKGLEDGEIDRAQARERDRRKKQKQSRSSVKS